MRYLLLSASALSLIAATAAAENPKLTVGGFADFQGAYADDDLDGAQRAYGFRNDAEVTVHVDGKTDAGLGYGAVIDLEADVSPDVNGQGVNASRTYLYADGGWGRVQLGSVEGAEQALKVDPSNIARATGGIDGDWHDFANITTIAGTPDAYLSSPRLISAHGNSFQLGSENGLNSNKITYYTPRWYGLQLGVSFIPDLTDRGQNATRTNAAPPPANPGANSEGGEVFTYGVNYEAQWNEISFGASFTGEHGKADDSSGLEDVNTLAFGAMAGYAGISLAASYGYWGDSLNIAGAENTDYWTAGIAYDAAAWGVSATYFKSEFDVVVDDNEFRMLSIGADYKLAPGLTPYTEVTFYRMYPNSGADNQGTVVLVGTELAF